MVVLDSVITHTSAWFLDSEIHQLVLTHASSNSARFLFFIFYRYLEKCTEFFRAFVSSHLRRVESNPHFSVIEFLTLLLKYSLKQVFGICSLLHVLFHIYWYSHIWMATTFAWIPGLYFWIIWLLFQQILQCLLKSTYQRVEFFWLHLKLCSTSLGTKRFLYHWWRLY